MYNGMIKKKFVLVYGILRIYKCILLHIMNYKERAIDRTNALKTFMFTIHRIPGICCKNWTAWAAVGGNKTAGDVGVPGSAAGVPGSAAGVPGIHGTAKVGAGIKEKPMAGGISVKGRECARGRCERLARELRGAYPDQ